MINNKITLNILIFKKYLFRVVNKKADFQFNSINY